VLSFSWHSYQTAGPDGRVVDAAPFGFFILPRTSAPLVVLDVQAGMAGERVVERARFPALSQAPSNPESEPGSAR
jgi:hypothetical protein